MFTFRHMKHISEDAYNSEAIFLVFCYYTESKSGGYEVWCGAWV